MYVLTILELQWNTLETILLFRVLFSPTSLLTVEPSLVLLPVPLCPPYFSPDQDSLKCQS